MQSSRAIGVSSTSYRVQSAEISRCMSCSVGRVRSQSCMRSKATCFAAGVEASRRVAVPPIGTSIEDAFAIAFSSATHHNRPVPSAKSLVT